jgi:hypothetical protein
MSEMTENQTAKIRKGLSARRDPVCYQTQQDIVIPAGTILRSYDAHIFEAQIGPSGKFSLTTEHRADVDANLFKRVIA